MPQPRMEPRQHRDAGDLQVNPAEVFGKRYSLALVLIAVLTLLSQLAIQVALTGDLGDGSLVNLAGRQRMLSQKIAKTALELAREDDVERKAALAAELRSSAGLLAASRDRLLRGSLPPFGRGNSPLVLSLFASIEIPTGGLLRTAGRLAEEAPRLDPVELGRLAGSLGADAALFLEGMDKITTQYDRESRQRVEGLRRLELFLFMATLLVLVLEVLFVFRPARLRIDRNFRELCRTMGLLEDRALHDGMTGLYNKSAGLLLLGRELEQAARQQRSLTLCFIDLDGLKRVNDRYGHEEGDSCILRFAALVKRSIRSGDAAFRFGGDEFVLLLTCDLRGAEEIVQRLREAVAGENARKEKPYSLAFSIGVLPVEDPTGLGAEALLASADRIMYEDKKARRAAQN